VRQRIEEALAELQASLGGADIRLASIDKGVVTVRYRKPLSNPSACHVDRGQITKDVVLEAVEDRLRQDVPEITEVIIVET
jgi:hypothetical protein